MNRQPILVPRFGRPTAHVSHWFVAVGESVESGERIVELLIPGLTIDIHATQSGTLHERTRIVGEEIREGESIGFLTVAGEHT